SADDTSTVARCIWKKVGAPVPLRIVKESEPGLSHARRRGIGVSQYGILVFVDDDNWLSNHYLAVAREIMMQRKEIGVLGGYITATFEAEPPAWFPLLQSSFA